MKPKMNLLENLQQQTASFKEMYLQKTEDWAKEQAKRNITRWNFFQKNAGNKKLFLHYKVTTMRKNGFTG